MERAAWRKRSLLLTEGYVSVTLYVIDHLHGSITLGVKSVTVVLPFEELH